MDAEEGAKICYKDFYKGKVRIILIFKTLLVPFFCFYYLLKFHRNCFFYFRFYSLFHISLLSIGYQIKKGKATLNIALLLLLEKLNISLFLNM